MWPSCAHFVPTLCPGCALRLAEVNRNDRWVMCPAKHGARRSLRQDSPEVRGVVFWSPQNVRMHGFATGGVATPIHTVKQTPRVVLRALRSWSGPFEPVFVKVLPVNARSIEAVCAWLAREIELPVPELMLLDMPAGRMPRGCAWPFSTDQHATCFATRAVENAPALRNVASRRRRSAWRLDPEIGGAWSGSWSGAVEGSCQASDKAPPCRRANRACRHRWGHG